jgi:hypothetical protein
MPHRVASSFLPRVLALAFASSMALSLVACGGGSSGGGGNPVPAITSLSPNSTTAGGSAFTLTVTGSNFISSSTVQWNGSTRSTTFVSATQLQAQITAADIASGAPVPVTVSNPAPGGGTSNPSTFTVNNPAPTITSLSPSSATAGSAAFSLSVTGTNFVSSSAVEWNGSPRTTTVTSSTQLQAQISAPDIASAGSVSVSVSTPSPGGGPSNVLNFTINSTGSGSVAVNQLANDLVWDAKNQVIYLSVPSIAGAATGNTISILNPFTGTITKSQFAGSEPDVLAISDDSQFLYVGLDGSSSVQRFKLPGLTTDINYSLGKDPFFGPFFALDLQVAPAAPSTTAVTRGNFNVSPSAQGGVQIFDDATMRLMTVPGFSGTGHLFDSLQWGSDATALYAANNEDTGFDFYTLTVSPSGVVFGNDYGGDFSQFFIHIHYDQGTKLVYADDGHVVVPSTGLPGGLFAASGLMVPDSTLNRAFFLGQTQSQVGSNNFTTESFDLTHFTPVNSITISNVQGNPLRLIRWGTDGLAFNSSGGQIILISGTFVTSAAPPVQAHPLIDHVQRTWETPKTFLPPGTEPKTSN